MPRLPLRTAGRLGAVGLGVSLAGTAGLAAQRTASHLPSALAGRSQLPVPSRVAWAAAPHAPLPVTLGVVTSIAPRQEERRAQLRPAALSLLVPGLGQRTLGQRRSWVYLSLEAIGWALYVDRRRAASGYRDRYRDFAWEVARIRAGPRIDPAFPYYETLSHWERSGAFDSDTDAEGVQPESDVTTYNGAIWDRAVALFLGGAQGDPSDPGYPAALQYYGERAWGPDFLWDWSGTGLAMNEYTGLIEASDDRARQATHVLGGIIANHLVAAVDAYLSTRGSPISVELRTGPYGVHGDAVWRGSVSWRLPR